MSIAIEHMQEAWSTISFVVALLLGYSFVSIGMQALDTRATPLCSMGRATIQHDNYGIHRADAV